MHYSHILYPMQSHIRCPTVFYSWTHLFLIYINDLVTHIQSTVQLFTDDCLIYHPIFMPAEHQILQEDLQKLSAWADKWEMKFNINKCCIMQLSKHHHKSESIYSM